MANDQAPRDHCGDSVPSGRSTACSMGFSALKNVGLENFAFEAVVLRHSALFSEGAVKRSRERMAQFAA